MQAAHFLRDPSGARAARRGGACLLLAAGLAPSAARAEAAAAALGAGEVARVATERDAAPAATPAVREANPLALRVTYHAPSACPSGSAFLGTLARHLAVGGEGAVDADVSISEGAGGFELTLRDWLALPASLHRAVFPPIVITEHRVHANGALRPPSTGAHFAAGM